MCQIGPERHSAIVESRSYTKRIAYDKMIYALGSTIDRDNTLALIPSLERLGVMVVDHTTIIKCGRARP